MENKLSSYHPIITDNFTWEFPTSYKLIDVEKFLNLNKDATIKFISQRSKTLMRKKSITWIVSKKENQVIVSLIDLTNVDFSTKSGDLSIILSNNLNYDEKNEIIDRLIYFLKEQISIVNINLINSSEESKDLLSNNLNIRS
ncbi:hypothetical protein [Companilactobacillus metriopterae]|uniref:hypothetical protein n=1 Tax=Companilactobacillus metriopterae TaxID=1909267 RepID=UPI00100A41D9|nr:hypothetical protein [Companilactobacillus metriopterae]